MRSDRLWLLGGVLTAVVLFAFGWFFFINPKFQEAGELQARTEDANTQLAVLRGRLAELREQHAQLPRYTAELTANRDALPETDSVASLLRQLQTAGELAGVSVSGVSVGAGTEVDVEGPLKVYALPISLTVTGPPGKINPFLDQLQKVQPRAVLISTVNMTATTTSQAGPRANVTISLQAFYAPGK